jgi:hypothetical protein
MERSAVAVARSITGDLGKYASAANSRANSAPPTRKKYRSNGISIRSARAGNTDRLLNGGWRGLFHATQGGKSISQRYRPVSRMTWSRDDLVGCLGQENGLP